MSFVVDASVAGSWLMPDERSQAATAIGLQISQDTARVPDLFWHEVRNALVSAHRRKRLSQDDLWLQMSRLEKMPLATAGPSDSVHVTQLALRHGLTAYDASYLSLALREGLPLASFDRDLRTAAKAEGVTLMPEGL